MDNQLVLQRSNHPTNRILALWHSTIGKKATMGLTGLFMLAWVIGHVTGNLLVFRGPDKINGYAAFLKSTGGLLWGVRLALLVSVVLHVVAAVQLTQRSQKARPVAYVKKEPQTTTVAARTIRYGGFVLLLFIVFHLLHLTAGVIEPVPFSDTDVYANLVGAFHIPWVVALYVVSMIALGLHFYHGGWSAMRTLGLTSWSPRPLERPIAGVIALLVWLGFTSIPLAIFLGFLN
jgi:succinate dehydrogenase / fumarate reductase cytochrome b subunit